MKNIWISDLHADSISIDELTYFVEDLHEADGDNVIITGDIATGESLEQTLKILLCCQKPIYYVHGNHDFYYSSFQNTRDISRKLCYKTENLKWVQEFHTELNKDTYIIGHDGFYDARYGSPFHYTGSYAGAKFFELNDFDAIKDIKEKQSRKEKIEFFNQLGDEVAQFVLNEIPQLAEQYKNIIFISHCPPFEEVSLYSESKRLFGEEHGRSPIYSLPFFSNKALGQALLTIKDNFPEVNFVTLFGHTHCSASLKIDNLDIRVADARYGHAQIFSIFEI